MGRYILGIALLVHLAFLFQSPVEESKLTGEVF